MWARILSRASSYLRPLSETTPSSSKIATLCNTNTHTHTSYINTRRCNLNEVASSALLARLEPFGHLNLTPPQGQQNTSKSPMTSRKIDPPCAILPRTATPKPLALHYRFAEAPQGQPFLRHNWERHKPTNDEAVQAVWTSISSSGWSVCEAPAAWDWKRVWSNWELSMISQVTIKTPFSSLRQFSGVLFLSQFLSSHAGWPTTKKVAECLKQAALECGEKKVPRKKFRIEAGT